MPKPMKIKTCREGIAQETLEISRIGKYQIEDEVIEFDNTIQSEYWLQSELEELSIEMLCPLYDKMQITCTNQGVVDVLCVLKAEDTDMAKVGVLNFASAYNPGGGFIKGSMAQEESLCYCSNLYLNQVGSSFYSDNSIYQEKYYLDNMIFSKATFFRDSFFNLMMHPFQVSVISAPAVNMRRIREGHGSVEKAKQIMRGRMSLILDLFVEKGCDTLILGAFGCGVFGNDAAEIAGYWKDLLESYNGFFKKVIMSVLDYPIADNYNAFKTCFD